MNLLGEFKAKSNYSWGTQAGTKKLKITVLLDTVSYGFLLTTDNESLIFYCVCLKIEAHFSQRSISGD